MFSPPPKSPPTVTRVPCAPLFRSDVRRLARVHFADAAANHLDRLLHRIVDGGALAGVCRRQHDARPVDDGHVPVALAGDADRPGQGAHPFPGLVDLRRLAQHEAQSPPAGRYVPDVYSPPLPLPQLGPHALLHHPTPPLSPSALSLLHPPLASPSPAGA